MFVRLLPALIVDAFASRVSFPPIALAQAMRRIAYPIRFMIWEAGAAQLASARIWIRIADVFTRLGAASFARVLLIVWPVSCVALFRPRCAAVSRRGGGQTDDMLCRRFAGNRARC